MITPMKYVSVICLKDDKEKVLDSLQKFGGIMLSEREDSSFGDLSSGQNVRRMEKLLGELKPYTEKKGLFSQNPQVSISEFDNADSYEIEQTSEMEQKLTEIDALKAKTQKNKSLLAELTVWENLSVPVSEIGEFSYYSSFAGTFPKGQSEEISKAADDAGISIETVSETGNTVYCIAAAAKGDSVAFLSDYGFEKASLPSVQGMIKDNIERVSKEIEEDGKRLEALKEELTGLVNSTDAPELMYERFKAKSERESAPFTQTVETVMLEGWVAEKDIGEAETAVKKAAEAYSFEYRDPLPEEEPPTLLENNKLVSQFEGITNMFSVPKYGQIDPNAVMAPWYWIIFGMMMADAGYGLLMAVLIFAAKKLMKPKGETAKLMNVLWYSSITTMIFGVLFGSYFGETWNPILFSPLENPVVMLLFTIVVGVIHIFTGMIVKIVVNCKEGKFLDAVFDQVSWIMLITGLGMLFLPSVKTVGIVLAAAGALIILFTAGRKKKGIFGKITGGLAGLYGITGYLSDILSYSRILALGLATGVVGMVMNMLAGMIQVNVIGFLLSLLIYIVGHIFNLVLGLLSAYVHDCRLQYIEFYSKFYEGSGKLFRPFAIQTKYIDIIK